MKSVRRKEEDYFFEYDNVYNMEPDELRAESASDTSVWYSCQVDNPEKISRSTIEVVLLLFFLPRIHGRGRPPCLPVYIRDAFSGWTEG